jgi:hypothetical protein
MKNRVMCWDFWVVRDPCSALDGNQRQTGTVKIREVLFVEKRKKRPGGHAVGPGNW